MNTRRDFLRKGAFAGLGMLTMSELAKAVVSKQNGNVSPKIKLEKDSVILFQGDSITDMFRKYDTRANGYGICLICRLNLIE